MVMLSETERTGSTESQRRGSSFCVDGLCAGCILDTHFMSNGYFDGSGAQRRGHRQKYMFTIWGMILFGEKNRHTRKVVQNLVLGNHNF